MAYLKSKWFFDFQKSRAFKKANEINGFVKFDISILVNSYGMPVIRVEFSNFTFFSTKKEGEYKIGAPDP
jgi:hypothetical protein